MRGTVNANTKYKNSVFTFLFSEPGPLRELYCALEDVTLPEDVPVNINTLQNVLFMGLVNDISFEIGGKLVVLIEHQSTINPNMALRLLMYIARLYEKMTKNKDIYSTKPLAVPRPEFFVLYNGREPYPDDHILKLSDLFENPAGLGLPEKTVFSLELCVRVLNINEGHNAKIVRRCKKLAEYSSLVAKVREYEQTLGDTGEAVAAAAKYCREHGILQEILEKHSSEVINMLYAEWNLDDAKQVWYEEGMEKGMEKGREEGREEGMEKGMEITALNALANGLPVDIISRITGLDTAAIENMRAMM